MAIVFYCIKANASSSMSAVYSKLFGRINGRNRPKLKDF